MHINNFSAYRCLKLLHIFICLSVAGSPTVAGVQVVRAPGAVDAEEGVGQAGTAAAVRDVTHPGRVRTGVDERDVRGVAVRTGVS